MTAIVGAQAAPDWAKSWHQWGLFNLQLLQHYAAAKQTDEAQRHVAPAVVGFFRSVALGQADGALAYLVTLISTLHPDADPDHDPDIDSKPLQCYPPYHACI